MRPLAIAAVVVQSTIAVTGSVVRVTGSGLGCPTWPQCFPGSLTPDPRQSVSLLHQWVEFGNRLFVGLLGVVGLACLVAALLIRPRRRRLIALAAVMPGGILVQAVLGAVTVKAQLLWWTVSLHFLASMPLIWTAVLLVAAAGEGDARPVPRVPAPLRTLAAAAVVMLGAVLVAGSMVTGAGPHAGDARTVRFGWSVAAAAQLHTDLLCVLLGLLAGLGFGVRAVRAAAPITRRFWVLVAVVLAQGVLGAVQYATGVPEVLVSLHVLGASLVVVAMAALWTALRHRAAPVAAGPAGASVPETEPAAPRPLPESEPQPVPTG